MNQSTPYQSQHNYQHTNNPVVGPGPTSTVFPGSETCSSQPPPPPPRYAAARNFTPGDPSFTPQHQQQYPNYNLHPRPPGGASPGGFVIPGSGPSFGPGGMPMPDSSGLPPGPRPPYYQSQQQLHQYPPYGNVPAIPPQQQQQQQQPPNYSNPPSSQPQRPLYGQYPPQHGLPANTAAALQGGPGSGPVGPQPSIRTGMHQPTQQSKLEWAKVSNHVVPPSALVAGLEGGQPFYIGRAEYKSGLHPGKVLHKAKACTISYDGKSVEVPDFEVLCAPPSLVEWKPVQGRLGSRHSSWQLVVGGHEKLGGQALYIGRKSKNGRDYIGKVSPTFKKGMVYAYERKEKNTDEYLVLTYR
ncbi:hypothetical protein EV182_001842 [Spiromyces aspiralis]|uniref:Uncharacterized protein n=1 Tax=Spiromyces aspiralis TaxID=68401 RepID=A0ACC1HW40_9FUNG|nr:hypothetical protein EV182_001842 [Spiromyces aspiralis]